LATAEHDAAKGAPDGLWRWLLGGLAAGGVILALLVGAYAIGYHRGKHHSQTAAAAPAPGTTSATTTSAAAPSVGPVTTTPALVARGKALYTADGCIACHSLSGSAGAGPALNGIAGTKVALTTGEMVTVDDGYLEQSIVDADAQIVKGYKPGIMPAAISHFDLAHKPNDLRALVAFIKSRH
jgi:cytochrome c oxidase subunit 2